jgi:hypothetical protein
LHHHYYCPNGIVTFYDNNAHFHFCFWITAALSKGRHVHQQKNLELHSRPISTPQNKDFNPDGVLTGQICEGSEIMHGDAPPEIHKLLIVSQSSNALTPGVPIKTLS